MFKRKRLAVHANGQHRISSIDSDINRESAGPSIEAAAENLLGSGLNSGLLEQITQKHALPHGIADVRTTNFVGDATNGDRAFDLRHIKNVLIGQNNLFVHHAVYAQFPSGEIDIWK